MVLRAAVAAGNVGTGFVVSNGFVKEVQSDAIGPVLTALLRIEVIERAPIVLVDVSVLNKHALGGVRNLRFETLGNSLRIKLRVDYFE